MMTQAAAAHGSVLSRMLAWGACLVLVGLLLTASLLGPATRAMSTITGESCRSPSGLVTSTPSWLASSHNSPLGATT
ncbi:hypothetical protein [Streptomyces sp. NPDC057617]|uniref:hypothetical protein n=1 Tax=Streptomyces sp. NPDC057617 TaxID=3346184 RepID=UPI003686023E